MMGFALILRHDFQPGIVAFREIGGDGFAHGRHNHIREDPVFALGYETL